MTIPAFPTSAEIAAAQDEVDLKRACPGCGATWTGPVLVHPPTCFLIAIETEASLPEYEMLGVHDSLALAVMRAIEAETPARMAVLSVYASLSNEDLRARLSKGLRVMLTFQDFTPAQRDTISTTLSILSRS